MIGQEILNYRIISRIGQGGMGTVYLAEHKFISNQKVAIKVIKAEMVNDYTRKMLKDEAEHLAGLHHQNIVTFHDYHIDNEGNIYLIMEYADGASLEAFINDINGLVVEDRICPLFEPILDGVGYAHKQGILHRDIKPANIVITTDGVPKILDFGIAKIINSSEDEEDRSVMGTPTYMSPEQVKGNSLDVRSDIYSLGVVLHQMLTGNAPYDTTTLTDYEISQKVVQEPLPRMKTYYKYISDGMQKVVDKATAKDPADRYQSCEEFKKALHNVVYPSKSSPWIKIAAAVLLALLIAGGVFIWDYNRTKVQYFKDYVEVWGVPQGIHKLSKKEVSNRLESYRIEYRKRKVQRLSHINSKGAITTHRTSNYMNRPTDSKYFYTADNKIDYAIYYDQSGKVDMVRDYNKDQTVVIFRYADSLNTEKVLAAETITTFTSNSAEGVEKGRISRYLLTHDDQGHVIEIKYAGFQNTIVSDADGLYGKKFKLDDKGRVIEEIFVNQDGELTSTKYGLGIWQTEYNEDDDIIRLRYMSPDRKPSGEKGLNVPVVRNELDQWGNTIRQYYEDTDGKPVYRQDDYIAVFVMDIENGLIVKQSYLDVDKQPTYVQNEGYASCTYQYDENGFYSDAKYFDLEGNLTTTRQGYSQISITNDQHGNVTELWYYDTNRNLVLSENAYSGLKAKYDSIGNQIEIIYYGIDKKPCELSDGSAGVQFEYNNMNLVTSITRLDKNLQPAGNEDNVPIMRIEYDKRGNMIKKTFYDQTGRTPCLNHDGVAGWNDVYDENGNLVEENFFDTNGEPTMIRTGHYAKATYTYDHNGNILSNRYYDLQGNLTYVDGVAGYDYIVDKRGNRLETKPIGTDGGIADGGLIVRAQYDQYNNVIEVSAFDKNGATTNYDGLHRITYTYNSRNQETEVRHYGKDGNLVMSKTGNWAIQKKEYNERGELCKCSYFGTDGKPCKIAEGWSSATYEHDAFGHTTKQCFFGVDGLPSDPKDMSPVGIAQYDKWGNMVFIASQDGNSNYLQRDNTKWAICRMEYDKRNNQTAVSYFDVNDKPTECAEGYFRIEKKYNKSDRIVETSYFDTNRNPTTVNGYHKLTQKYDENSDHLTEYAFFGTNDKPVNCAAGWHKMVFTYKSNGSPSMRKVYLANGTLLATQRWTGDEWKTI